MFELIMITMLFLNDIEELFNAGPANKEAGRTWLYTGSQPVSEGDVAIPSVNPDIVKETVILIR